MAVCPVRRQCSRFQAPGYTEVQGWTRPGSSRISRLGGWANGALHCCTNSHCNPITLEAPQLLHGRTAGSPCRDGNGPGSLITIITESKLKKKDEGETRKAREKGEVKGEGSRRKPTGNYLPSLSLRLSLKLRLSLYISLMVEQDSLIRFTSCSLRIPY